MSVRRALRSWGDRFGGEPYERALARGARERRGRIVYFWNRGLGDIALGLVPMFARAAAKLPDAAIEVVTRADLAEPFRLTAARAIHVVPGLQRGERIGAATACARLAADPRDGALAIDAPDPTRWLAVARRPAPPRFRWSAAFDALAAPLVAHDDGRPWIAVHASTETAQHYRTVKDWPADAWRALFAEMARRRDVRFVLLGHARAPDLAADNVIDLRGRTGFLQMLALVRARCTALVAPDGGVLNAVYLLDASFPITVVSLWSDPRQGLLKSRAASPNPHLVHVPFVGAGDDVRTIAPADVLAALEVALAMPGERR
ncbi:MAG: glycosyltransferase family 9 protein [Betaproteobacteria bacterium]